MNTQLSRYATPATVGLFAISTISGLALFFHLAPAVFHEMHEWLSVLLLAPFILHLWKNWPAMVGYARRGTLWAPVIISLAAALIFAVPALTSTGGGLSPQKMAALLTQSRIADLAPLLKTTPEGLQAQIRQRGYKIDSPDATLTAIAAAAGVPSRKILGELLPAAR